MRPYTVKTPAEALNSAITLMGGLKETAAKLGVNSYQVVQQWRRNGVPIKHCSAIESATGGEVTRKDLRPHDWQQIWPGI
jgi:DNA-binding transcriptional regulator YdaS (Cro superfamily)